MADRFRELLKTRDYIIFDGAMGTMLQAAGMKMGETPEVLNITRPELLVSIAEQYYNAGSDVVYANTFGANRYKLEECGKSVEELVTAGIVNAKKARDTVKPDGLVARAACKGSHILFKCHRGNNRKVAVFLSCKYSSLDI